jgi:excisionase family DNA binding protein
MKELYSPREVADLCGVTSESVVDWARAGKIPSVRTLGGHRRFTQSAVREVLRRQGYPIPVELQHQGTWDALIEGFKKLEAAGVALPKEILQLLPQLHERLR